MGVLTGIFIFFVSICVLSIITGLILIIVGSSMGVDDTNNDTNNDTNINNDDDNDKGWKIMFPGIMLFVFGIILMGLLYVFGWIFGIVWAIRYEGRGRTGQVRLSTR